MSEEETLASNIKSEDVISDEHPVTYDMSEIDTVLSQLNEIDNAMRSFKGSFSRVERAIIQAKMSLHQVSEEELPE